jgi:hypothetical protein
MELSIIILSYNTKDLILSCIESIIEQYRKELEKNRIEIIVVDNNSADDSVSAIASLPLKNFSIKLILNKENVGFGRGANIGAKTAKGKYILFLNSDTQAEDNGFLKMADFLEKNPKVAILGGKLHNADGSAQPSTGKFYNLPYLVIMLLGLERLGFLRSSPDKIRKVDWVSGACIMVRQSVFEKLTGFDEKLFMYMEDMEICFRAQKLGFATYFYLNVKLMHKSLGSSNKTFAIINIYQGVLHFYSKHKNYFQYVTAKALLKIKAKTAILVGIFTGNSSLIKTYGEAIRF